MGLAANAASTVGSTNTEFGVDPAGIILNAVGGFAEITLYLIMSFCFILWNWHLAFFIIIGFIGLSAVAFGAHGIAIMAISMSRSVCRDNDLCVKALKKGMAASCIRAFLIGPFCLALMLWYFFKARKELVKFNENQVPIHMPLRRLNDGHDLDRLIVPEDELRPGAGNDGRQVV
ncbi:hypothetical protein V495_05346 [Pseudogymnoascus sp. VKM F-4514 (FW-929)]|nr:hypothetical protein V495_05346 [Pseudogymnoascus sp. VKM F-4514 (FW-929)]